MNLKKQKAERKKWNVLDWILLVLATALLFGAVGYVWYRRSMPGEQPEVRCVIRLPAVDRAEWEAYYASAVVAGSTVRSENGTLALGTVQSVSPKEHTEAVLRKDNVVWEPVPELADIELEVRMHGTLTAGQGVRVGDLRIAAGGSGSFRIGGYFAAGAEIVSVEVVKQ